MPRIRTIVPAFALVVALLLSAIPTSAQTNSYVVRSGDTVYSIATRHGLTPEQLMALNGLSTPMIYVGQILHLSTGAPAVPSQSGQVHTVQPGDTLFSIARRYGTTVDALMATNHLPSHFIYAGQTLRIAAGPASPGATAAPGAAHIVVVGDTLFNIAARYHVSVAHLKSANGLTSDLIYLGQSLRIPSEAAPPVVAVPGGGPVYYFVQPGDSLTRVAMLHGVSVGALAQVNNLRPGDWIYTGQRLIVPSGAYDPAPPVSAPPVVPGQSYYHIVRPGETLTHIAAHYRTTIEALVAANKLTDASHIFVGQRLHIPGYRAPVASPRPAATPIPTARAAQPTATSKPPSPSSTPTARPTQHPAASQPPFVPTATPSNAPPPVVRVWKGEVTQNNCTTQDTREFRSIVRVNVEGRVGHAVDLFAQPAQDSNFITWVKTGTKSELGPHAAEIAPLGAGNYTLIAQGLASVDFYLDGQCTVYINFYLANR